MACQLLGLTTMHVQNKLVKITCPHCFEEFEVPMSIPTLTPHQMQIIRLISAGITNRGISVRLGSSEQTVHHTLSTIYDKLGVNTKTEAILYCLKQGLITMTEIDTLKADLIKDPMNYSLGKTTNEVIERGTS